MIIDTSAILAILYQEEDAEMFAHIIASEVDCKMSAANFLEAAINIDAKGDATASRQLDAFMKRSAIAIESITFEQAQVARQAYIDYGKGNHPAKLNFGDCFAYALAKTENEPLLFKGNDFIKTDLQLYPKQ